jgi:DNA (cytosine-5)-methyltransferase 1
MRVSVSPKHPSRLGTEPTTDGDAELDLAYLRRIEAPSQSTASTIDIVDLFSGCGGMTLGALEGATRSDREARLALAIDNDAAALDVLKSTLGEDDNRFSTANLDHELAGVYEPVRDAERELLAHATGATLLLAGPPCQGHSSLNNSTRHDDPRNDLYLAVARAAKIVRPKVVIAENVRGVGRDKRAAMSTCIAALEELGYEVASKAINLHEIGVPQTRIRHVLVATESKRFEWSSLPMVPGRTLEWAIGDLLDVDSTTPLDTPSKPNKGNRERIDWLFENDEDDLPNPERPDCHKDKEHSYVSMYGRLRWDAPAQTVTSGFGSMGQGRYVHPLRRRTLTPHEAARLQFLPDLVDFRGVTRRSDLATIIGNVAPPRLTIVLVMTLIEQGLL